MPKDSKNESSGLGPFLERPSSERFEAVLSSISDGLFTVDKNWRITCFNRAAQEITGYSRAQAMGKPCHEIFRANICPDACALRYTMETGNPVASLRNAAAHALGIHKSTFFRKVKKLGISLPDMDGRTTKDQSDIQ